MKNISVAILNWNGGTHVERCLESIVREFPPVDIFLIDNGSTDGSQEKLQESYPSCQYVQFEKNYLFAGAYNRALPDIIPHYRFVLLLNNDTALEPGFGAAIRAFVEQLPPSTGLVAMKMVLLPSERIDNFGIFLHPSGLGFNAKQPGLPLCPSGGAALYRSTALQDAWQAGHDLFDEDFGMYCEDLDLGLRCRLLGWSCALFEKKVVYHAHGLSVKKQSSTFAMEHMQRNQFWVVVKNYPGAIIMKHFFSIVLGQILTIGFHILHGRGWPILRAKWRSVAGIRRMARKRKLIMAACKSSKLDFRSLFTSQDLLTLWRSINA